MGEVAVITTPEDAARAIVEREKHRVSERLHARRGHITDRNIHAIEKIKIEREIGMFLKQHMPGAGPGRGKEKDSHDGNLFDTLGISKSAAYRWASLCDIPDDRFTKETSFDPATTEKDITSKSFYTMAQNYSRDGRDKTAKKKAKKKSAAIPPEIRVGDFRQVLNDIPDNSVDLVFTDPPYDRKSIPLYGDLAEWASRKLRPGGHLVAYSGHFGVPDILPLMTPHLRFHWLMACVHTGQLSRMNHYGVIAGFKPLFWFVKGQRTDLTNMVSDVVSGGREKCTHPWQQSVDEAVQVISKLCPEGGLVVDPFCGGGTTAIASIQCNRKWLLAEVDQGVAERAALRIDEVKNG